MESNKEKLKNLIDMLRELDLERNSIKDIRYVLNFIADRLEELEVKEVN